MIRQHFYPPEKMGLVLQAKSSIKEDVNVIGQGARQPAEKE